MIRNIRWLFYLLLVVLGAAKLSATHLSSREGTDSEYVLRVWHASHGLHSTIVRAMVQASNGYLWLATDQGLTRFDGIQFTDFDSRHVSETHSRWVIDVIETSDGSIWASSSNGGVSRLKDGVLTRYTVEDGLNDNFVLALHEDRSGRLWLGTASGLMYFADGKFHEQPFRNEWRHRAVRAIAEDDAGDLWVGTSMGLLRLGEGRYQSFSRQRDHLVSNSIMDLQFDRSGTLWIGTHAGLTLLRPDGVFEHFTVADGLAHDAIRAIHEDREGRIWIGSHGGLQKFTANGFKTVQVRDRNSESLAGRVPNLTYAILEDREGNIWAGTSAGLCKLSPQRFSTIGKDEGLPLDVTTAVLEDRDGFIWVGTWGGGLNRIDSEGNITTWTTKEGLASDHVLALEQTRDGSIWIGTDGVGVNRLFDGKFTHHLLPGERAENTIRVLQEDRWGRFWAGANKDLYLWVNGEFVLAHDLEEREFRTIGVIEEDVDGTLWIGSAEGLTRFDENGYHTYSTEDGLSSSIVITIFPDPDGSLWVATEGGGLSRMTSDGEFFVFTDDEGLFRERILHIRSDDHGFFWLSTRNGLYRIEREKLIQFAEGEIDSLSPVSYGIADGLRREQGNGIAQPTGIKARDGSLWFVTMGGVVHFDPAAVPINRVPPSVLIEQVKIDGNAFHPATQFRVPPGRGRLEVSFTGISLQVPEKVRFRYRLDGSDTDWHEGGTKREVLYNNLPPGTYRFRVIASNNDGIWSDREATFSFRLAPHFYQTAWFYGFCALGFIGVGAATYRMRVRHIRRRHDQLARLVDSRTMELQAEIRERRAAQRRTALFSRLGQQLSLASTLKEAAETILAAADELIGWDSCCLHTYSAETNKKHPVVVYDLIDGKRTLVDPETIENDVNPFLQKVIDQGPQLVLRTEREFAEILQPFGDRSQPSASLMFAPMRKGEETVGMILMYSYRFNAFDNRDLETLQTLADYCAGAFERIRAEEALRESQEVVLHQERLAAIGQLSSGAAHEFNNILTIIKGHSSLLLNEQGLPRQATASLREIAGSAERAANLTRQLLTFSRKQFMRPEVLDLNRVVQQVVDMLRQLFGERLVVKRRLASDLAPVSADLTMMEQVVMNLAVNARDAMAQTGGELTISTSNVVISEDHPHPDSRPGKFICLTVADTGCGMDAATLRQIFEPFFTTKGVGEGTGLGLASVYGIVTQHRGWIEVKSSPEKGSEFRIFLPAEEQKVPVAKALPIVAPANVLGGEERILLVEDETGLRQMALMFLTAMRYNVFEAANGTEALRIWEEQKGEIDLLFTDMVLPNEMSGRDLARKLRNRRPDLPVILTSGYSREIIGGNIEQEDSVIFVPKPYSPQEIGEIIRNLLGRKESEEEVFPLQQ